jgi:ATP-binding cassette subfamily B protein RaxB
MLQTTKSECGLVCVAMIANYHGHRFDIPSLRRRFSVSLKGGTLKGVIALAGGLQLQARPVKISLDGLHSLRAPCILHWDMTHFVVLKEVRRNGLVIHDPASGAVLVSMEEASKHFTGIAVELSPSHQFKPQEERQVFTIRSLMGRVTGLRRGLAQILLLGIALQCISLLAPFYLQWVVDEAVVAADRDLITVLGIGFLLLVVMQTAISAVRSWVTTVLATDLNFQWLGNSFAHMLRLPLPYFEKRHLGDIVSRFESISAIQRSFTTQFVEGVIDGILVLCTGAVMLMYSVQLTAIAFASLGLYTLLRTYLFGYLRNATAEQIIHQASQQTHLIESTRGMQSVRLFHRTEERRIGWTNKLAEQFNAELRIAKISVSAQSANTFLVNAERVLVVWLAAYAVMDNKFTVGMLFAFMSFKDQFTQRMSSLIDKLFELRMLRLHGERVADILLSEPEPEVDTAEMETEAMSPSIEFRNISFRFSDSEPYVLRNLNLTIPSGQSLALTGGSGSGKTTLVKLLLGLLEPNEGEILVSGVPIASMGFNNFRQLVGTVMQDDQLFAGTIAENISFFEPQADQERILEAARLAAIFDEINQMPMRFNTLVGDIGTGLSGGQKQRILLARALYKNPRILILDEATSHLDIHNEQRVNASIKNGNHTRLMVAHRQETINTADRVVLLEGGQIIRDFSQTPAFSRPNGDQNIPAPAACLDP